MADSRASPTGQTEILGGEMMEAKDTVVGLVTLMAMGLDIEIMSINGRDDGIKALREHLLHQAEISFKMGYNQALKKKRIEK